MPFGGRPSKGCAECRRRRIKCDQSRPGCMRCSRAGWKCSGYRNELDLMFCDQSEDVVQKIRGGKDEDTILGSSKGSSKLVKIPQSSRSTKPIFTPIATPETISDPSLGSISRLLVHPMPLEVLARNHFLKNWISIGFVIDPVETSNCSSTQTPVNAHSAIRDALGIAGLSFEHNAPEMISKAIEKYALALKSLNKAVTDDTGAKQDQTLMAIMLMMIFELVTTMSGGMDPWWHHVLGAIAILKTHNPRRVGDHHWIRMFYALRHFILFGCMIRFEPIPDVLVSLSNFVAEPQQALPAKTIPDDNLFAITRRLCDLRAGIVRGNISNIPEIVSAAEIIDNDLDKWSQYLPPTFAYTTSLASNRTRTDDFLQGSFHVYPNFIVASQWNMCRTGRILAMAILLRLKSFDPSVREKYKSYQRQMAEKICASVPFLLDTEITRQDPNIKPRSAGGCLLLCPLAVIASLVDSEPIKAYVLQRLQYIGRECGVKRAYILYELFTKSKTHDWSLSQLRLLGIGLPYKRIGLRYEDIHSTALAKEMAEAYSSRDDT